MKQPANIYGVDFSGATDAGTHLWIAQGMLEGRALTIKAVFPASTLIRGVNDRAKAYAALRAYIAQAGHTLFGMDFPFGLHVSQVGEDDWLSFVRKFATRFPDPDDFYHRMGGRGHELRRSSDSTARTPFAPTNLRIYRQTYYGIRDLLAPLVLDEQARVFPMQEPHEEIPTLIEVCPAVTLMRLGLRLKGYKGRGDIAYSQRKIILGALRSTHHMHLADEQADQIMNDANGDALDSVIAALGTAHTIQSGALERAYSTIDKTEGIVFG
jgi:hypothetical protein